MKFASVMRFGGELVEAEECSHDDFEYLKPLCPECKEPVYLRKGGDRISKLGKAYRVLAYWSHFQTIDPTLVERCEQRVGSYDQGEIAKRAAVARNQRLKFFQRWFWQVIRQLPLSHIPGEVLEGIVEPHWDLYDRNPAYRQYSDAMLEQVLLLLKDEELIKRRIDKVLDGFLVTGEFDYFNESLGGAPAHLLAHLDSLKYAVDLRLQRQITFEAIGLLRSARGQTFLRAFNFNAIVPFFNNGFPALRSDLIVLCVDNVIAILGLTPWSNEFEKLKKEGS